MRWQGIKTGGGSQGQPNKLTADVKAMIPRHWTKAGGRIPADTGAIEPNAFLTLVGKVLPMTVAGDPANRSGLQSRSRFVERSD